MTTPTKMTRLVCASIAATILCGGALDLQASGKASDPAGAPSTGGAGGGGGGGKGGTTSTTPAPKPAPTPILIAPLTFIAQPDAAGNVPLCTGSYQIDPYYPTLSLLTLNVSASSVNVPDGTSLYVIVNLVGYGYLATSNIIPVTSQTGSLRISGYVALGTTIQSVVITDASGTVIAIGN
jgi:hypothetical protein